MSSGAANARKVAGLVTTALSIDFFGRADLGQWLEFDTQFAHCGKSHGVTHSLVLGDGAAIARASATFRIQVHEH